MGVLEGFLPHLHLEQSEVMMCSKYANERIMSVMVKRPMRRPSSTIGSFLILRSLISLTASRRLVSGCEAMRGVDIMSLTLVILGSLNWSKTLLSMSRSVMIPMGFPLFITIRHPMSCLSMSSATFFTGAGESTVITFLVITSLTNSDIA